jgi:transposase
MADVDVHGELEKLRNAHAELLARFETVSFTNATLERENAALRSEREALLKRLFGPRSEKAAHNQQELFEEAKTELDEDQRERLAGEAAAPLEPPALEDEKPRRRRPLPADLERERRRYELAEHERRCKRCHEPMQPFGEEVTEELEYVPASLRVIELARTKYACKRCHDGVVVAPGPDRPIEKGRPGPGLLAHVAVSKFADHVPLYRQSGIFERIGIDISRKTMSGWMGAVAELLAPVVDAMKQQLLSEPFLQSDDTPVPYQDRSRPGKTARGYLWTYTKPWAEVVYEFTTTRSRAGPRDFLAGFEGHLQADGYSGYNALFRTGRVAHIGCMAHVRRKFFESREESPHDAELILAGIQKLYRIERQAKDEGITGAALVELRRDQCVRVLDILGEYITDLVPHTLPKSGFGRAVRYAIDQWPAIRRYVDVAEAELDNNSCEHTVRPVALGRKNWLFAGSVEGGKRAATIYSLVTSCRRLGIDPQAYLTDVISRAPAHKMSKIDELTPRAWQLEHSS